MIGDLYHNRMQFYIVISETPKTKTLMQFEPIMGNGLSTDPCIHDVIIAGIYNYIDSTIKIRLSKDDTWKYKGKVYTDFTFPYNYKFYCD